MDEAFRTPQHLEFTCVIDGFQVKTGPFPEVGRAAAKIDRDVPYMAGKNPNKFSLGFTKLVVQPAKNPPRGEGLVVLNKGIWQADRSKGSCVENFGEPTATIPKSSWLNELNVVQRSCYNLHPKSLAEVVSVYTGYTKRD